MKLTKRDLPYFSIAAVVVYGLSICMLYFSLWIIGLLFPLPEIPTAWILLTGLLFTTMSYIMDAKKFR